MKYLGLVFILFFTACSEGDLWDARKTTEKIFAPDEEQFRRFEIGMSKRSFDAAYTGNAIFGNEMEVIDSLTAYEGVYCETAFRFNQDFLAEIVVTIFIDDETQKEQLLDEIKIKLKNDYGDGENDNGQYYWRGEGGLVTTDIFLRDLSSPAMDGRPAKYVISLYYTIGSSLG